MTGRRHAPREMHYKARMVEQTRRRAGTAGLSPDRGRGKSPISASPSPTCRGAGSKVLEDIVRRSILLVSAGDREGIDEILAPWGGRSRSGSSPAGSAGTAKGAARAAVPDSIAAARRGGAEVFVRIDRDLAYADIEASAWPGLTGIMLPSPQAPDDVRDAAAILTEMERRHGLAAESVQTLPPARHGERGVEHPRAPQRQPTGVIRRDRRHQALPQPWDSASGRLRSVSLCGR